METILAVAFGRVVGVQRGEADDLTSAAMQLFRNPGSRSGMMIPLILDQFPFLEALVRYYSSHSTAAAAYSHLQRTAGELVRARRAMGDRQKEVWSGEDERREMLSATKHTSHCTHHFIPSYAHPSFHSI